MGLIEDVHAKPETVRFFKIDEAAYDPKTQTWGTDRLIAADNYHTVTIPADVRPGLYMVRHEIVSLRNALNDDWKARVSGARFYPQCLRVRVTGGGDAAPRGKPSPACTSGTTRASRSTHTTGPTGTPRRPADTSLRVPVGAAPEARRPPRGGAGALPAGGPLAAPTARRRRPRTRPSRTPRAPAATTKPGADPATAVCAATDPDFEVYRGHARPPVSPMYVDEVSANRGRGSGR